MAHLEGRSWHAAQHDKFTASATTSGRDASNQRALSMFRLWRGTSSHHGTRPGPTTTPTLFGRHGACRSSGLAVFGGGEQTAEHHTETGKQVPVAATTRDETQVIEQDHQRANTEEGEHENR